MKRLSVVVAVASSLGMFSAVSACSGESDPTARELYEADPENCANLHGIELLIGLEEGDDDVSDDEQRDREELLTVIEEQQVDLACAEPFESALGAEARALEVEFEDAECLAEGWMEAIGVETFLDQEVSPEDARTEAVELTEEQASAVVETTDECVGMAVWFMGSLKGSGKTVPPEVEECVAEELDVDAMKDAMTEVYTTDLTDQLADIYRSLAGPCPELADVFGDADDGGSDEN